MLRSTADLLIRIHNFFDEIDYAPTSENFSDEKFFDSIVYTINHSKELGGALYIAREYLYYLKKEEKFLKKLRKYSEAWNSIEYHGREEVAVVGDNEANGVYYITNLYGKNYKEVYLSGQPFGNDVYYFQYKDGYFSFGDDSDYFLRYARLSSTKMILTDKNKKNIATIVLSEDLGIFLENNKTDYELAIYESGIAFFDKDYYRSLYDEEPDLEKHCKAFLQWDIIDGKSEYGLSRLEFYDANADLSLMIMLAASCFLVFRSYVKDTHGSALTTILAANVLMGKH